MKRWTRSALARRTLRAAIPVALTVAATLAPSVRAAEAPTDTLCAWGRLSDGKGALVRCLTRDEATRLREPSAPAATLPRPAVEARALPGAASDGAKAAPPPAPSAPVPEGPSADTKEPPAPLPVSPAVEAPKEPAFAIEIGRIVADVGAFPDASKSLHKAQERLGACVKAGGVAPEGGEVELRFLVQARGRAEGVSVQKRRGVTAVVAKCVAGVVDRRFVGYPDEPEVGATLVVAMKKK